MRASRAGRMPRRLPAFLRKKWLSLCAVMCRTLTEESRATRCIGQRHCGLLSGLQPRSRLRSGRTSDATTRALSSFESASISARFECSQMVHAGPRFPMTFSLSKIVARSYLGMTREFVGLCGFENRGSAAFRFSFL